MPQLDKDVGHADPAMSSQANTQSMKRKQQPAAATRATVKDEEAKVLEELNQIQHTLSKLDHQKTLHQQKPAQAQAPQVQVLPLEALPKRQGSFESTNFSSHTSLDQAAAGPSDTGKRHPQNNSSTNRQSDNTAKNGRQKVGGGQANVTQTSASRIPVSTSLRQLNQLAGKQPGKVAELAEPKQDATSAAALRVHYQVRIDQEKARYEKMLEENNAKWSTKMRDLEARVLQNIQETNRLNQLDQSQHKILLLTEERDKLKKQHEEAMQRAERDGKVNFRGHLFFKIVSSYRR